jgi:hypothetical protein
MGGEGGEDRCGREEEDPRVPQVHSTGEERLGLGQIRFFNEAPKRLRHGRKIWRRSREFKPAITRLGPVGANAEGNQLPFPGRGCGGLHGGAETGGIRDDMVRRRDEHQRARGTSFERQGSGANSGGSVLGTRLDQDIRGCDLECCELFDDNEAKIGRGDDRRRGVIIARETPS